MALSKGHLEEKKNRVTLSMEGSTCQKNNGYPHNFSKGFHLNLTNTKDRLIDPMIL